MAIINGVNMPDFEEHEFSEDPTRFADVQLLKNLQLYRELLGAGISPSQASGALARFEGKQTSMHSAVKNKQGIKSKAIDIFTDADIFESWTIALSSGLFNGVGVYFDTNNNYGIPQPMIHLDLRSLGLIWYRDNGKYFYPHKNEDFFINLKILLMRY